MWFASSNPQVEREILPATEGSGTAEGEGGGAAERGFEGCRTDLQRSRRPRIPTLPDRKDSKPPEPFGVSGVQRGHKLRAGAPPASPEL
jgi:hypothetical protein